MAVYSFCSYKKLETNKTGYSKPATGLVAHWLFHHV